MSEFVVVDVETTGLDPKKGNEIIEIGITEIKSDEIHRNYSRFIKPVKGIPPIITEITHITNDMVKDAKSIEEVLPKFRKFLGDRTMIAHNAKFDIKFLNHYLEKQGLEPITKYICTIEMLKKEPNYDGKNNKLETACKFYGIENKNAHRADSDTLATAQLFLMLR
ncbi:MAG: 3'-5' exonuclease [Peptostreptococcaceae bacterium]